MWSSCSGLWLALTTPSQEAIWEVLADQGQKWVKVSANTLADSKHLPELSSGPVSVLMHKKPIMPSALDKFLTKDRSSA